MSIQNLKAALDEAIAAGEARPDDLVIGVEYDRIRLRAARPEALPRTVGTRHGYHIVRESAPIHGEVLCTCAVSYGRCARHNPTGTEAR